MAAVTRGRSQLSTMRRAVSVLQVTTIAKSGARFSIASISQRAEVSSPLEAPCSQSVTVSLEMSLLGAAPRPNRSRNVRALSVPVARRHRNIAAIKGASRVRIAR